MKIIAASNKVFMMLLLPIYEDNPNRTDIQLVHWDCVLPEYKKFFIKKQTIIDGEPITYHELDVQTHQ